MIDEARRVMKKAIDTVLAVYEAEAIDIYKPVEVITAMREEYRSEIESMTNGLFEEFEDD